MFSCIEYSPCKALVTLKRVVPSDLIWNKFRAFHWLPEKKEGRRSNGRHETYFKWYLMAPHISMSLSLKVYSETCVIHTSVTFHYNVCSKMMASTWNKCHGTCFKCMPSFYYIHCSETWHLCEWHTFHCRRPLMVLSNLRDIHSAFVIISLHKH